MFRDAVALEDAVVDTAFEMGSVHGLKAEDVKQYMRYLADRRLIQLGLKGNFKVKDNPLKWLDWIVSGDTLKNFFEGVVTDYNASGMTGDWGWGEPVKKEEKIAA
jgi:ribonucleoside-diphosphate reductase beta chain